LGDFDLLYSSANDILKQQQEHYRSLTILNATTLILTIAFADKFIKKPDSMPVLIIPVIFFVTSLLCSLYMMRIFGEMAVYIHGHLMNLFSKRSTSNTEQPNEDPVKKRIDSLAQKANRFQGPVISTYTLGILSLLIIVLMSISLKNWILLLIFQIPILLIIVFQYDLRRKFGKRKVRQGLRSE
jgi:hypothetical protein